MFVGIGTDLIFKFLLKTDENEEKNYGLLMVNDMPEKHTINNNNNNNKLK